MLAEQRYCVASTRQFHPYPYNRPLKRPMKRYCQNTRMSGSRLGNQTSLLMEILRHSGSFTRHSLICGKALRQRAAMFRLLQRVSRVTFTRVTSSGMQMSGCFLHYSLLTPMRQPTSLAIGTKLKGPLRLGKARLRVRNVRQVAFLMDAM